MPYTITNYTRRQAKRLGVVVKRSTNPAKKLDVYKPCRNKTRKCMKKIASVGATGYGDYPTFMKKEGKKSADEHRRRYKIRHEKDRHRVGTRGYYADKLLW